MYMLPLPGWYQRSVSVTELPVLVESVTELPLTIDQAYVPPDGVPVAVKDAVFKPPGVPEAANGRDPGPVMLTLGGTDTGIVTINGGR